MEFIKCIKVLFQKALTLGTPSEKEVLYSKVIQKEAPKESTEKHRLQAAIETIGNVLKNTMSIVEHEEGIEFGRGTPTPPPKMAKKPKTATKKSANKEPKAKKEPTSTKKTATTKKETPVKKTATKKTTAKTKSTTTKIETDKKSVAKKPAVKKSETKTATNKTSIKKVAPKKTMEKKTGSEKKASTKTAKTTGKTEPKKTTTKKAEKIALYTKDIQKHYGEVDNDFLAIIVKNLGPSIYKKDAELVSCSDPKELNTVRKNFLIKKLGIDASQKVLDAAIEDVCKELKATRKKYRATFYYSLAKKFKKESVLS